MRASRKPTLNPRWQRGRHVPALIARESLHLIGAFLIGLLVFMFAERAKFIGSCVRSTKLDKTGTMSICLQELTP